MTAFANGNHIMEAVKGWARRPAEPRAVHTARRDASPYLKGDFCLQRVLLFLNGDEGGLHKGQVSPGGARGVRIFWARFGTESTSVLCDEGAGGLIPFANGNHSFAGASLAMFGLISVLQQRASQAKPLHGSASKGCFSLGKGLIPFANGNRTFAGASLAVLGLIIVH
jgi:hypothetical protein